MTPGIHAPRCLMASTWITFPAGRSREGQFYRHQAAEVQLWTVSLHDMRPTQLYRGIEGRSECGNRATQETETALRFRMPASPLFAGCSQLCWPRVIHDAVSRRTQRTNLFPKLDKLLIGHEAQTFAQLLQRDFLGFKGNALQV